MIHFRTPVDQRAYIPKLLIPKLAEIDNHFDAQNNRQLSMMKYHILRKLALLYYDDNKLTMAKDYCVKILPFDRYDQVC